MLETRTDAMTSPRPAPRWPIWGVIALGVLPELILMAADAGLVGSPAWRLRAYGLGAFWSGLLMGWQSNYLLQPLTMFATYALLHTGPVHMITNMIGLAVLGPRLQSEIGTRPLLWLYALSILVGALCFALLAGSPRPMVGASGGLYGLVTFWILGQTSGRPLWTLGALLLLAATNFEPITGDLAWETHLGGALIGALLYVRHSHSRR